MNLVLHRFQLLLKLFDPLLKVLLHGLFEMERTGYHMRKANFNILHEHPALMPPYKPMTVCTIFRPARVLCSGCASVL